MSLKTVREGISEPSRGEFAPRLESHSPPMQCPGFSQEMWRHVEGMALACSGSQPTCTGGVPNTQYARQEAGLAQRCFAVK